MGRRTSGDRLRDLSDVIFTASREGRPVWLDTAAMIMYLQNDVPYAEGLAPIIEHPGIPIGISTITLAETLAGPARFGDELSMRRIRVGILKLPRIVVAPFDEETAVIAARVRGRSGLKLPDAGIIASAIRERAVCIVGNDLRWRSKEIGLPFFSLSKLGGGDSKSRR
ncbi:hypothetical protein BH23CHL4_BH23CHL4_14780 [soil metagenome]